MRIGIDLRLPAYRMGGISQYILHLVPALAALDSENEYLLFHSRKDRRSHFPEQRPNFHHRRLWTPCHHRLERWSLSAELLPHGLDLLHSPDFIPPAAGARRRIITVHDLNFIYYPQFLTDDSRRYYLDQIGWAVNQADHIIADSHHTRRDLMERLQVPAARVTTVHLAANPIYHRPVPSQEVQQTLEKYDLVAGYILFVGTLEPRKNIPTLLQAFRQLVAETGFDLPLVLVGGKGWLYEEIFATIGQLRLTGRVRHLSGVPDVELAHLYSAAALLAQPSHYEGFGLPPLEAMHCGCPVLSSDRASLPEVVGDAGRLLPPDDAAAWAAAMAEIVQSEGLRREMAAAGYRQAERFSWPRAAEATLAIYRGRLPEEEV